jgi:cell division protein FtsZ
MEFFIPVIHTSKEEQPVIELDSGFDRGAKIRVVGVGGGGGNAVNSMIDKGLHGVDFFAINTDLQALERNQATNKIQIGKNLTRGLGAGADPTVGQRAVEEDRDEITRALSGSDMVFITAGMGGGTGTGGAPIVANIAKSLGALVVGIVTIPFRCEGKKRLGQAEVGIQELKKQVDTLIVIPNQKLLSIVEPRTPLQEAFDVANQVLHGATRGISELITVPGLINVDFADVRTVMREMGDAVMGSGVSSGENRAVESAHAAISSPLLDDVSISGALGVLVNITGGPSMSLFEVEEATEIIHEAAGDEANVILGAVVDENMKEEIMVTVIATGFNRRSPISVAAPAKAAKPVRVIERIPTGVGELREYDEPAFARRGIELTVNPYHEPQDEVQEKIDKTDPEKPAFLRKIMD